MSSIWRLQLLKAPHLVSGCAMHSYTLSALEVAGSINRNQFFHDVTIIFSCLHRYCFALYCTSCWFKATVVISISRIDTAMHERGQNLWLMFTTSSLLSIRDRHMRQNVKTMLVYSWGLPASRSHAVQQCKECTYCTCTAGGKKKQLKQCVIWTQIGSVAVK